MEEALLLLSRGYGVAFNSIVKLGSYYSSYFDKSYDVLLLDASEGGIESYWIAIFGSGVGQEMVFMECKPVEILVSLKNIRNKFIEWKQVANNNVTSFIKPFEKISATWMLVHDSGYNYSIDRKVTPTFMITEDGTCCVTFSGLVNSPNPPYTNIDCRIVLSAVEEFDKLISLLEQENIDKFINRGNLFK